MSVTRALALSWFHQALHATGAAWLANEVPQLAVPLAAIVSWPPPQLIDSVQGSRPARSPWLGPTPHWACRIQYEMQQLTFSWDTSAAYASRAPCTS